MLELVDRHGSGPCARKSVEVQVLSPARMRRQSEILEVLELAESGFSSSEIARMTGVPRSTVRDWRMGFVPRRSGNGTECENCGHLHQFSELPPAYVYLLGLYLGDGSIATHARQVYKLRLNLDAKYPEIIREAQSAMRAVIPESRVNSWTRPYGDVEVYSYSKAWPCLFPQHGKGFKHSRSIILAEWQESLVDDAPDLMLRGLIHSDGCRFQNTGRNWSNPRYGFKNFSPDIRQIFRKTCDRLGLHTTESGRTVYVSRKADVERMDEFIGPKR